MFDAKKLQDQLKKNKKSVVKTSVLVAAGASVVASGDNKTPAGSDKLVVIGVTKNAGYTAADLKDFSGSGIDVSAEVDLATANNNKKQTVSPGDIIDGGTAGKELFLIGDVDLRNVTLKNITAIYLDGEVFISNANIKLNNITEIGGTGTIKSDVSTPDLDGIKVPVTIVILDALGNVILPVAGVGALSDTATANENSVIVGHFSITDVSSVGKVTYVLTGKDADLFEVDEFGVVTFKTTPDFEDAKDDGKDNFYDITITATDEHGKSASQDVAIEVKDVDESPAVDFPITTPTIASVDENQTSVLTVNAGGTNAVYSLSGLDKDLFSITNAGVITFNNAPDFETRADAGGDGLYNITIDVIDDNGKSDSHVLAVNVINVNDAPEFTGFDAGDTVEVNAAENQTVGALLTATDDEGDAITYTLSGGADMALFSNTNGNITFANAPDFENPQDNDGDIVYEVIITATDANGAATSHLVKITVTDEADVNISLSALDGTNGFALLGVGAEDKSGASVSSAGDVNGDGYDDLIVGARKADNNANDDNEGASYIIFGGGQYAANDEVATSGDDALVGTVGADTIDGLAGDDVIRAGAADDVITGGTGADRMYGGGGADTFIFTAGDSKITITENAGVGTISGYDTIEDFKIADGTHASETLEIVGTNSVVVSFTGLFNGTDSTIKVGGNAGFVIKADTTNLGIMTFFGDDNSAIANELFISTESDIAAVMQYLQANSLGAAAGISLAFDVGADTFTFTQGSAGGVYNDADLLVRLEDVQIENISLALGAGDLFLQ